MINQKTRLTPEEALDHIGCKYDKLMQMVRKKEIPHYRIGRRVFFTKETLDEWIDELEKKSVKPDTYYRSEKILQFK